MLQMKEKEVEKKHSSKVSCLKIWANKSGNFWDKTECGIIGIKIWFGMENQDIFKMYLVVDEFETLKWKCQLLGWIQD